MIKGAKILFFIPIIFIFSLLFPVRAYAVGFTLDEPTGPFSQGQVVEFTINIDTQGQTLTSAETNMTYDTNYLEYVSTNPGALFPNVTGTVESNGNLKISASVDPQEAGVTGAGTFALISFRLTGSPPSDVKLCALVSPTPTLAPTVPPQPTTPPVVTAPPPVVTSPPVSTLPRSGTAENLMIFSSLGIFLTFLGVGLLKVRK